MIKLTELNNDEFIWILDTLPEWSIAFDDIADHIETGLAMVLACTLGPSDPQYGSPGGGPVTASR